MNKLMIALAFNIANIAAILGSFKTVTQEF